MHSETLYNKDSNHTQKWKWKKGGIVVDIEELSAKEMEELRALPAYRDYSGEYRYGMFGNIEEIQLLITDDKVEGRGYLKDMSSKKKFIISDFSYSSSEFIGIFSKEFDGKQCSTLCPKLMNKTNEIYFPGISAPISELKNSFKLYQYAKEYRKNLAIRGESIIPAGSVTPEVSVEPEVSVIPTIVPETPSVPYYEEPVVSAPEVYVDPASYEMPVKRKAETSMGVLDDEMLDFKSKVEKLRIMKETGLISEEEFSDLRKKLTNLFD